MIKYIALILSLAFSSFAQTTNRTLPYSFVRPNDIWADRCVDQDTLILNPITNYNVFALSVSTNLNLSNSWQKIWQIYNLDKRKITIELVGLTNCPSAFFKIEGGPITRSNECLGSLWGPISNNWDVAFVIGAGYRYYWKNDDTNLSSLKFEVNCQPAFCNIFPSIQFKSNQFYIYGQIDAKDSWGRNFSSSNSIEPNIVGVVYNYKTNFKN